MKKFNLFILCSFLISNVNGNPPDPEPNPGAKNGEAYTNVTLNVDRDINVITGALVFPRVFQTDTYNDGDCLTSNEQSLELQGDSTQLPWQLSVQPTDPSSPGFFLVGQNPGQDGTVIAIPFGFFLDQIDPDDQVNASLPSPSTIQDYDTAAGAARKVLLFEDIDEGNVVSSYNPSGEFGWTLHFMGYILAEHLNQIDYNDNETYSTQVVWTFESI